MSLSNAVVKSGATIAPSGGTDLTFESQGSSLGQNRIIVSADTDLRTRREIMAVVKEPRVQSSAPNGYTQARSSITFKSPLLLDNGLVTVNTLKLELSTDVETSSAEKDEMLILGAQFLTDSDFTGFFKNLIIE